MRKQWGKILLFVLVFASLITAAAIFVHLWENKRYALDSEYADMDYEYDAGPEELYYNGEVYLQKELESVLLIGVDQYEGGQTEGYINSQQSDFLMLLLVDHSAESFSAIPINRDTMTEIDMLGLGGQVSGSFVGQLALAHTYGSGGTDSCRNTVNAVSGLLYDSVIDHYASVTMDVVTLLNDAVGGVTVNMLDDFTDVDPEMIQGKDVTLHGEQALTYVRSRAGLEDSRNIHRMERQSQYITALKECYSTANFSDSELSQLLLDVSEYLVSDCPAEHLSTLYEDLVEYEFTGFREIEGESVRGDEYMEFYADEDALKALVLETFYEPEEGQNH